MTNSVLDPWEVNEADFPATGSTAEKLAFILNYAVMAPSGHNTQPWQFRLTDDCIELYADRTAALPVIDPEDRELTMSCGAALFNLRVALRYFGYKCDVQTFPKPNDSDLLAEVRLGPAREPSAEDKMLFAAIPKRRTNRNKFEDREVPEILLSELQVAAAQEGAWLHVIQRDDVRTAVADLIAEGDRQQWQDESFRRELASWTHSSRQMRRDGIPGYAKGVSETAAYAGPNVLRTFDMGNGEAAKDHEIAMASPALVVLGTDADTPAAWLAAGQALERILLRARAAGVWASYLNQPIEIPALRTQLSRLLDGFGYPQLLLRLGYGPDVRPTPRRRVSEVIIDVL